MDPRLEYHLNVTRRHFLKTGSLGLGAAALSVLGGGPTLAASRDENPFAPQPPHFPGKATSVIYLHMSGSPSNLDMFDYKPELTKRGGQAVPADFMKGKRFAFTANSDAPKLLATPRKFKQYGKNGDWFSDAVPHMATVVDDLTFIRSMHSEQFNHAPGELLMFTGSPQFGRPTMGSWVTWGIGSENENLPGFIVLVSAGTNPFAGNALWSGGFLPSVYQGVQCRTDGEPVLYITNPQGMNRDMRRESLDALKALNEMQAKELGHPETATRIAQYEMAFRMQIAAPEIMDISRESKATLDSYGAQPGKASFANNCLLARRLIENGVRFVQLHDWGWDFHGNSNDEDIRQGLTKKCQQTDQPIAALIKDLKQRGMLEHTLVVYSGEFGRTPFQEGTKATRTNLGRDHHPYAFTIWMAGAGLKPGFSFGASDELGLDIAKNKVHVHDLQATILHLLGFDHKRLTYRYSGRDFRLTDVAGDVVKEVMA